jgi:hypothetical protein
MRKIFGGLTLALLTLVLVSPLALAWDVPPVDMEILKVYVYPDLVIDGDTTAIFYWNLPYTDNFTTTPASETIMFQFLGTDGATVMSGTSPYVFTTFNTNGYGWGVSSFYFPPEALIEWKGTYSIRITQSPVYFESPTSETYPIPATSWSTATTQTLARKAVKTDVLKLCDLLAGHYTGLSMKASLDTGIVLNSYGEAYFRASVPGLQVLCPELFAVQVYNPSADTPEYDLSLPEQLSQRLDGSEIKRSADRLGDIFKLSGYALLGFIAWGVCIWFGVICMQRGWGIEVAIGGCAIILGGVALLMGNMVFTIVMGGAFIATILIMFQLFQKRA